MAPVTPGQLPPKYQIEALLFASGKAMTEEAIINVTKLDPAVVKRALKALQQEYEKRDSALIIWNDDSGWKMSVREAYVTTVKNVVADTELSRACLETLAVIAYKYPGAMQSEVVDMRGGGAYEHIAELERLGFVMRESSGRSYKLKLTEKFFQYFDVAGGKDIRTAFKDIKVPEKPKVEMQSTLGAVQVVPVDPLPEKKALDGMEVVGVSANPEIPGVVREHRMEKAAHEREETPKADAPKVEESEEHRKFLEDLDARIAQVVSRNDTHDADPLFQKRLVAEADPNAEPAPDATDSVQPAQASGPAPEDPAEPGPEALMPEPKRRGKKKDA